jgi:hypothetical protein
MQFLQDHRRRSRKDGKQMATVFVADAVCLTADANFVETVGIESLVKVVAA